MTRALGNAGNDRLTALREEVRRAGKRVQRLRVRCVISGAASVAGLSFIGSLLAGVAPAVLLVALAGIGLMLGTLAVLLARPAAACYRRLKRAELAGRLAVLPPSDRAAILLPLCSDHVEDTRKIAGALLREFRLASEVSPVTLPEGRGDEAAAG